MDNAFYPGVQPPGQADWPFGCRAMAAGRPWAAKYPSLPGPAAIPGASWPGLVTNEPLEAPWQELAAAGRLALTAAARLADWDPGGPGRGLAFFGQSAVEPEQAGGKCWTRWRSWPGGRESPRPPSSPGTNSGRPLADRTAPPGERAAMVRRQMWPRWVSSSPGGPGGLRDRPGPAGVEGPPPGAPPPPPRL